MSRISDLAYALHSKTMEKRLNWEIQDERSITTNIGKNSITLEFRHIINNMSFYNLFIRNFEGEIVDSEIFRDEQDVYQLLDETMIKARRDSLRADETLDEIMEKINAL